MQRQRCLVRDHPSSLGPEPSGDQLLVLGSREMHEPVDHFEELPRRWSACLADEQRAELRRRAAIDLVALGDAELFAHIRELRMFTMTSMQLHFELMFPHASGVHELCRACEELPASGRRVNGAMMFLMSQEATNAPPQSEGVVRGIAASGGTYRGRVRVIPSVEQLHLLRSGEVLVCPSTCAAWPLVFHRAGALVTDFGGALTHTSIVACEHRLPAVVGTYCATATLDDGEEVIVDRTLGTVTRIS